MDLVRGGSLRTARTSCILNADAPRYPPSVVLYTTETNVVLGTKPGRTVTSDEAWAPHRRRVRDAAPRCAGGPRCLCVAGISAHPADHEEPAAPTPLDGDHDAAWTHCHADTDAQKTELKLNDCVTNELGHRVTPDGPPA